jgi:hypothetical protein
MAQPARARILVLLQGAEKMAGFQEKETERHPMPRLLPPVVEGLLIVAAIWFVAQLYRWWI